MVEGEGGALSTPQKFKSEIYFSILGGGGINPLALLVAPLAAISLLAAAAAVAINPVLVSLSLFRNKGFVLNEMLQRNASKFALFYV